jgi:hypothetical protein
MLDADSAWRETGLGELITTKFTEGLSEAEKEEWKSTISGSVALANAWKDSEWVGVKDNISNIYSTMKQQATKEEDAKSLALKDQTKSLEDAGF